MCVRRYGGNYVPCPNAIGSDWEVQLLCMSTGWTTQAGPSFIGPCPPYWYELVEGPVCIVAKQMFTMEAKILALAHSYQELFLLIDITKELGDAVGLPLDSTTM